MAVTEVLSKVQAKVVLNDGVDSDGKLKTVNVGLGTLDPEGYDAQKLTNIATALLACLSRTFSGLSVTKTVSLLNS